MTGTSAAKPANVRQRRYWRHSRTPNAPRRADIHNRKHGSMPQTRRSRSARIDLRAYGRRNRKFSTGDVRQRHRRRTVLDHEGRKGKIVTGEVAKIYMGSGADTRSAATRREPRAHDLRAHRRRSALPARLHDRRARDLDGADVRRRARSLHLPGVHHPRRRTHDRTRPRHPERADRPRRTSCSNCTPRASRRASRRSAPAARQRASSSSAARHRSANSANVELHEVIYTPARAKPTARSPRSHGRERATAREYVVNEVSRPPKSCCSPGSSRRVTEERHRTCRSSATTATTTPPTVAQLWRPEPHGNRHPADERESKLTVKVSVNFTVIPEGTETKGFGNDRPQPFEDTALLRLTPASESSSLVNLPCAMISLRSSARLRLRMLAREEGISMIIVIGVLLVTSLLLVAAFTSSQGEIHLTARTRTRRRPTTRRRRASTTTSTTSPRTATTSATAPPPPPPTPRSTRQARTTNTGRGPRSRNGETPIEQYAIQLLPAESAPSNDKKCDTEQPRRHDDRTERRRGGHVPNRVDRLRRQTRSARSSRRSRTSNFVSYVWYTKYETGDPSSTARHPNPKSTPSAARSTANGPKKRRTASRSTTTSSPANRSTVRCTPRTMPASAARPRSAATLTDRIEFGSRRRTADEGYSRRGLRLSVYARNSRARTFPSEVPSTRSRRRATKNSST